MNRKYIFALGYRIVFVLVGWFGVIGHFYQKVIHRPPEWSVFITILDFLKYYTIQTNLFVVIWLTIAILYWKRVKTHPFLKPKIKGAFTLYITITFIIYAVLLAKLWNPDGIDRYLTAISHYVTPIAFILDWVLFERKGIYQWRYALHWLIYPFFYFIFVQIYGGITGKYLYPFLNLQELGLGGLALRVAILLLFFSFLACVYIGINRVWGSGRMIE